MSVDGTTADASVEAMRDYYARRAQVYERVCAFHRRHGELWTPAPLLRELALGGGSFS